MKQLGLACLNYESANGCFPPAWLLTSPASYACCSPQDQSFLVRLLPFFEQGVVANACNFNHNFYDNSNITIAGIGLSTLWCPSDFDVSAATPVPPDAFLAWLGTNLLPWYYPTASRPAGTWLQQHTSYFAMVGIWEDTPSNYTVAEVQRSQVTMGGSSSHTASLKWRPSPTGRATLC